MTTHDIKWKWRRKVFLMWNQPRIFMKMCHSENLSLSHFGNLVKQKLDSWVFNILKCWMPVCTSDYVGCQDDIIILISSSCDCRLKSRDSILCLPAPTIYSISDDFLNIGVNNCIFVLRFHCGVQTDDTLQNNRPGRLNTSTSTFSRSVHLLS